MMKAILVSLFMVVTLMQSNEAVADDNARASLTERLAELSTLEANFEQKVLDRNGEILQQSSGHMALARPNSLYWQSDAPNEMTLVADGQSLWYFDPFVEQVTVYDQTNAEAQSPLLLLLDSDAAAWADYEVSNEGDSYALQPKAGSDATQSLQLVFAPKSSVLKEIIVDDGQGQINHIQLRDVKLNVAIAPNTFKFEVPEGAIVDDQRNP